MRTTTRGYDGETIKLGERVRVMSNMNHLKAGEIGKIIEIDDDDDDVVIEFDDGSKHSFFPETFSSRLN